MFLQMFRGFDVPFAPSNLSISLESLGSNPAPSYSSLCRESASQGRCVHFLCASQLDAGVKTKPFPRFFRPQSPITHTNDRKVRGFARRVAPHPIFHDIRSLSDILCREQRILV